MNKIREFLPPTSAERALLAAQRIAIFGYDPCAEIHSNRIVQEEGTSAATGSGWVGYDPAPGTSAWIVKSCDMGVWPADPIAGQPHRGRTSGAATTDANGEYTTGMLASNHGVRLVNADGYLIRTGSLPDELPVREVDVTNNCANMRSRASALNDGRLKDGGVMHSDAPGIASAALKAAKNAKPAPEPVLSIGGSEFNTAELLEALQLVRAKHAPAVKETPRGLMVVREFDHRLGLWDGEGC